jgi:hypothetical protein
VGSAICAAHIEGASLSGATCGEMVVEMVINRICACTGAGRVGGCSVGCALDSLFKTGYSSRRCTAPDRIPDRLRTCTATPACRAGGTKMRSDKIAFAIFVITSFCGPAFAQSHRIQSGSANTATFQFFYETQLDPPVPELAEVAGGTIADDNGLVHRFMLDHGRRVYFGYDALIEVLPEPYTYRITFNPLTMSSQAARRLLGDDATSWTPLPTPDWAGPTVRTIRMAEVLALNLLTNNTTGQKIVDYITVQEPRKPISFANVNTPPREFRYAPGPPRDFRVEDAELRIRAPRVTVNGKLDPSTVDSSVDTAGVALWFYLPTRGRFILSLTPHPELGFHNVGEIRGSILRFTIGEDNFSLASGDQIAPGPGPFNLYVLHDVAWKPTYQYADTSAFMIGTADSPDPLIGK